MSIVSVHLDRGWSLHQDDPGHESIDVAATVPGCTHTDLLDHDLIPDPFVDTNEHDVAWVAARTWRYSCEFSMTAEQLGHDHLELAFDGLDTLATISVNGVVVGTTANMHRRYRFDIRPHVAPGANTLDVVFRSATARADALRSSEGDWPSSSFGRPFNYLRKMACSWGWDWGPWLTSAGIWRPARLEAWSRVRIGDVRPTASVDADDRGTVAIDIDTTADDEVGLVLTTDLHSPDGELVNTASHALGEHIVIDAGTVARWWPHTHGDQPLYEIVITVADLDGRVHDRVSHRIGFRTIELDTSADATGSAFTFVVNGQPIFVRGVNWIPDDPFPSRITDADYRERLHQAVDANVDMIRVWGGGIYEDDRFYDTCDELGLLVWQDFLFACAAYPEHLLADEVEAEARDNVSRLMRHTSLAIWNGNNENIWGYWDWAWQDVLGDRTYGAGFYFDSLPRVTNELDPTRPYWPGSPYSGSQSVAPNADAHGCVHVWDVWNQLDLIRYRDHTPRFVAEFGWQAPPTWPTMADHVSADQFTRDSPAMRNHQKAEGGDGKLDRGIVPRFGEIERLDAWWYAAQVVQARALQTGIEHFRSLRPYCMGTIWWQLNDCWPVASWAVVDGAGRLKPSWYALRDAYRDRLLTIQPRGDRLVAVAVNDTGDVWNIDTTADRHRLDGTTIASTAISMSVEPHASQVVELATGVAIADDPTNEVLVVGDRSERAWWWFASDRDLRLLTPDLSVDHRLDGDDLVLAIRSDVVVRDLSIQPERVQPDAKADRQLVNILPGEVEYIRITGVSEDQLAVLLTAPACWSVADLIGS